MTTNFKRAASEKTPIPPDNYVRFRKHFKSLGDGSVMVCPNCSMPKNEGDRWGYCWDGSGYADPQVQATYEQYVASGEWRRAYMGKRVGALLAPDGTLSSITGSRYLHRLLHGLRLPAVGAFWRFDGVSRRHFADVLPRLSRRQRGDFLPATNRAAFAVLPIQCHAEHRRGASSCVSEPNPTNSLLHRG